MGEGDASFDRQVTSTSDAEEIDAICDALEAEWRGGSSSTIESVLASHGERLPRQALFEELLAVEVAYRILRGEAPRSEDYVGRFPEEVEIIQRILAESAGAIRGERLSLGTRLGHYQIGPMLGAGGMGEVYRAHDVRLGRDVALKVLRGPLAGDQAALDRFGLEARALASLSHPNILTIHDFGRDRGVSYFVMELLDGETLRDRLRRGPMPWPEVVELGCSLAAGLAAAHAKGIVHRDIKPGNIFLTTHGAVKVLDFGLAALEGGPDDGLVLGTRPYMSPEQVRGELVDARSDLFSTGTTLYEALWGRRAFAGESSQEIAAAISDAEPEWPLGQVHGVPTELVQIVERCLSKRRQERFGSASELGSGLRALSTRTAPQTVAGRGAGTRSLAWVAGAAVVLAAVALAVVDPPSAPQPSSAEDYRRGRRYLEDVSRDSLQKAIASFERAIELHPDDGRAWAGLAEAYLAMSSTHLPPRLAMPKAEHAARAALSVMPALAEAHASLAVVKHRFAWDAAAAEAEHRHAIELDRGSWVALQAYGRFATLMGRFGDAQEALEEARRLSPLDSSIDTDLAFNAYYRRRYDEAIEQFLRVLAARPETFLARWGLAEAYLMSGRASDAVRELERARTLDDDPEVLGELGYARARAGDRAGGESLLAELETMVVSRSRPYVSATALAVVLVGLGRSDEAFVWLERAIEERDEWLVYLGVDPIFDPLRGDARFSAILGRVGLW